MARKKLATCDKSTRVSQGGVKKGAYQAKVHISTESVRDDPFQECVGNS